MFMNLATSKYCPPADASITTLKYKKTLPEIYELKEYIDIQSAYEMASYKDQEENRPKK